jgi:uncharacterized ParB-like nuclease family protein
MTKYKQPRKDDSCPGDAEDMPDSEDSAIAKNKNRKIPEPTGPAADSPCGVATQEVTKNKSGSATKEDDEDDQTKDIDVVKGEKKGKVIDAAAAAMHRKEADNKKALSKKHECDTEGAKVADGPDTSKDTKNI